MPEFLTLTNTQYGNFSILDPTDKYNLGFEYLRNSASSSSAFGVNTQVVKLDAEGFLIRFTKDQIVYSIENGGDSGRGIIAKVGSHFASDTIELPIEFFSQNVERRNEPHCQLIISNNSITFLVWRRVGVGESQVFFASAGEMVNVTTQENFFSATQISRSYTLTGGTNINTKAYTSVYGNKEEALLDNYAVLCEDRNFRPNSKWLTDLAIFSNRSNLNRPYIGLIDGSIKVSHINDLPFKPIRFVDQNYLALPTNIKFSTNKKIYVKTR